MSNGLYEILGKIREKPGMYIGKPSVNDLFMFIVGYEFARGELDIESTPWEDDFHENFHSWIESRFKLKTSNSWAKIIMLYSVDEKDGFLAFFQLLDEFQNRHQKLNISDENINQDLGNKKHELVAV